MKEAEEYLLKVQEDKAEAISEVEKQAIAENVKLEVRA